MKIMEAIQKGKEIPRLCLNSESVLQKDSTFEGRTRRIYSYIWALVIF